MTFTSANWNTPQTVTVTGVDDFDTDGDVAFTIITAAASADPDYNGLDAIDVQVTNLDDEGPLEYEVNFEPPYLKITDNNTTGINSTINVPVDYLIAGLNVTLNIDHQRPSDLTVFLIPPDGGPSIRLFNFQGDNIVAGFNSGNRRSVGDWKLQVSDNKHKKTGTLNGWKITIHTP